VNQTLTIKEKGKLDNRHVINDILLAASKGERQAAVPSLTDLYDSRIELLSSSFECRKPLSFQP